jgi:hypothetical protein
LPCDLTFWVSSMVGIFFLFFWRLRCLILLPYRRLGLGLLMWWIVRLVCCNVETLKSSWFYILHLTFRLYSVRFKIVWVHWCWCYTWSAIWIVVCYINGLVGSLYVCFGKWDCYINGLVSFCLFEFGFKWLVGSMQLQFYFYLLLCWWN